MKQPEFYGSTTISDKGQVVIPIEARTALGLEKGEKLLVMGMHGDSVMLMKVSAIEKFSAKLKRDQAKIDEIIEKGI